MSKTRIGILVSWSHNEIVEGVFWFHPVRLSVRPASNVRSVAPTVLVGSILYLCVLSSNFIRCVACKDFLYNFKICIFGNFLNL